MIIIPYSGATKVNIQVAQEANRAEAKIVSITHLKKSPLIVCSDSFLLCYAEVSPLEVGFMSAKIRQLYPINLLYQEYLRKELQSIPRKQP